MKKFNVNVNGTVYQVEVEEVGGTVSAAPAAPAAPAAAAPVAAAPVAAPAAAPTAAPDAFVGGQDIACLLQQILPIAL